MDLLQYIKSKARPEECLYDTARRLLTIEALDHEGWSQTGAARLLRVRSRRLCWAISRYLRPSDVPTEAREMWYGWPRNPWGRKGKP